MVHFKRYQLFVTLMLTLLLIGLSVVSSQARSDSAGSRQDLRQSTAEATEASPSHTTLAANKALLQRVYDVFNSGNVDDLDEFVAEDFVDHTPGVPPGRQGLKQVILGARAAFPDLIIVAEDLIAEGDKVVSRGSWTGTHTGPMGAIAATGKKVKVEGIDIIRVQNGKIVEHWEATDNYGLMVQLGVIQLPK